MGTALVGFISFISLFQPISSAGITTTPGLDIKPLNDYPFQYEQEVWVTAYTSAPEETDGTPFITALGTRTRDGVVATNMFPFGTRIKIPEHFGDKIFVVEDRMHSRKVDFVDVWMSSKRDAFRFGISRTKILVLN